MVLDHVVDHVRRVTEVIVEQGLLVENEVLALDAADLEKECLIIAIFVLVDSTAWRFDLNSVSISDDKESSKCLFDVLLLVSKILTALIVVETVLVVAPALEIEPQSECDNLMSVKINLMK